MFPGRVVVGAPRASRSLTVEEILSNLDFFRAPGPRERPIQALTLSGLPSAWLEGPQLEQIVDHASARGIAQIVLHLAPEQTALPLPGGVAVATAVRTPEDVGALRGEALSITVPLLDEVLDVLDPLLAALALAPAGQITLLWPFPAGELIVPPADRIVSVLSTAVGLEALRWGIKGLPRCVLKPISARFPDLGDRVWRSLNRFYVDADHQLEQAMLFQPELVSFDKLDSCRFCALDLRCDGVASAWLGAGLVGALEPVGGGS